MSEKYPDHIHTSRGIITAERFEALRERLEAFEKEADEIRAAHGWKRDGRPLTECMAERLLFLEERLEADPDVMNAKVREERIVELEDENELLREALNETNERWERACSDLEAKVERLRTLQKHEADVYRKKVEENEQLRNLCDIAGREEQFAIDEEEKLQAHIEAALAIKRVPGMGDDEFDRGWTAATDAFREALKGEGE